mgnify:FL=1
MVNPREARKPIYCNFCGSRDDEVECMIAANLDTNICASCVDQCTEIIKTHRDAKRGEAEYESWFCGT